MKPSDVRPSGEYLVLREEEVENPSNHDLAILEALGSSFEGYRGSVSFQGIRRKLGLHQETLSRALHRLERDGFIMKSEKEYKVSPKGEEAISRHAQGGERAEAYSIPILRTILPGDSDPSALEASLSHKWFGNLRWFGSWRSEDGTTLTWITPEGKMKLKAKISEGYLSIESEAISAQGMSEAVKAAYEIFHHISKAVKEPAIRIKPEDYRAA
ncbi:MAG: MarR family transcriptional regulator [Nitrososphaerales archaeon]